MRIFRPLPAAILALRVAGLVGAVPAWEAGLLAVRQASDELTTTITDLLTTTVFSTSLISTTVFTTVLSTILQTSSDFATVTVTSSNVDTATFVTYITSTLMAKRFVWVPEQTPVEPLLALPTDDGPYKHGEGDMARITGDEAALELARRALITVVETSVVTRPTTITTTITSTVVSVSSRVTTVTSTITSTAFANAKTTVTVVSTLFITSTSVAVVPTVFTTAVGPTVTVSSPGGGETGGASAGSSGSGDGGGGLSTGAKAGIGAGVGGGALLILAILGVWWCRRPKQRPPTVDFTPGPYGMAEPTLPSISEPTTAVGTSPSPGAPKYGPSTPPPLAGYRGVVPARPMSDDYGNGGPHLGPGGPGNAAMMGAAAAVGAGAYNRASAGSPAPTELSGQGRFSNVPEMDGTGGPAHPAPGHGHSPSGASELDNTTAHGVGPGGQQYAEIDSRPARLSHAGGPIPERYEMP